MKQRLWLTIVTCLVYCVDKELWKTIDYLKEQVRVLQEQQEKDRRILLNDDQRVRLAAKAKQLTRKLLEETTVLFTPDTILGWYRKLIAQKYDGSKNCKNPGRPKISQEIVDLVIQFKEENPHWGYTRIKDYIVYLGYKIGETTVKNILLANGYDPEPDFTRKTTWKKFIRSHWSVLAACDFFSVELLVKGKLIRCMVLFAMDLSTRKVAILGVRPKPNGLWMTPASKVGIWQFQPRLWRKNAGLPRSSGLLTLASCLAQLSCRQGLLVIPWTRWGSSRLGEQKL